MYLSFAFAFNAKAKEAINDNIKSNNIKPFYNYNLIKLK